MEYIDRLQTATNELRRKSLNEAAFQALKRDLEDWKGLRPEMFGELLLHGDFSVRQGGNDTLRMVRSGRRCEVMYR